MTTLDMFPITDKEENRVSERWHMTCAKGRTYIMYGPEHEVRERAATLGYSAVTRSGQYEYHTNTIVDAKDGPTVIVDVGGRFSGPNV